MGKMMKNAINFFIAIIIILMVVIPVFADEELEFITDNAYLLTEDEYWELNSRARDISEKYECDISIITVEDMGSGDVYGYADSIRKTYGMGYGDGESILLLFVSMEYRDYALIAHGYGNTAFTDYGKDMILDKHVLPLMGKEKYYKAFSKYLSIAEEYLKMSRNGAPFDIKTDPNYGKLSLPIKAGVTFLIPLIIAAIICSLWKSKMKTAVLATTASNYITADGLVLTNSQDHFLYRTESRRRIENKSTSSGGTTRDRSGVSGRSGKF
ncbi:MAG TPA: TPM domain-containing protein [Clostridia bacterium]|nr:TPM domain-containing protein [Clostridia bacterium]